MGIIKIKTNRMKYLALAALVATAQAAVGQTCSGTTGCEETECCGTATPDEESAASEPVQVCQTDSETLYVNADDEEMTYTFACNTKEEAKESTSDTKDGSLASNIAAAAAAILSSAVLFE